MKCKLLILPALISSAYIFTLTSPAFGASDSSADISAALRVLWGLLIVLGILLVIYGIAKKKLTFLHSPGKGIIKIVEVRHLMPKKSLYLVEVRGREYLLGAGGDRIELLAAIGTKNNDSFADVLDKTEKNKLP